MLHCVQSPINGEWTKLKKVLIACTSQCPFLHMDDSVYVHNNSVAMGSLLGVTFSNYYMTNIKNAISDINTT